MSEESKLMDKCIPATPELLRIGQVIEEYSDANIMSNWTKKVIDERWLSWFYRQVGRDDILRLYFRIPLITHVDIIELGWKSEYKTQYRLGLWHMEYHEDRDIFIICRGMDEYEYALKTRLDLADLMRLLGINASQTKEQRQR